MYNFILCNDREEHEGKLLLTGLPECLWSDRCRLPYIFGIKPYLVSTVDILSFHSV